MEEKDYLPIFKELGELAAKVDMLIQSVNTINTTMANFSITHVPRTEFEELKRRVDKQETAIHRWLPHILAGAAIALQFIKH